MIWKKTCYILYFFNELFFIINFSQILWSVYFKIFVKKIFFVDVNYYLEETNWIITFFSCRISFFRMYLAGLCTFLKWTKMFPFEMFLIKGISPTLISKYSLIFSEHITILYLTGFNWGKKISLKNLHRFVTLY